MAVGAGAKPSSGSIWSTSSSRSGPAAVCNASAARDQDHRGQGHRGRSPPLVIPYGGRAGSCVGGRSASGAPPISGLPLGPFRLWPVSFGVTLAFWGGRVLGLLSASNFFPARTRIRCTGTAQPLRAVPGGSPRGASRAKEMRTFPVSGSLGVPRGRLGAPRGRKVEIARSPSMGCGFSGRSPLKPRARAASRKRPATAGGRAPPRFPAFLWGQIDFGPCLLGSRSRSGGVGCSEC